MLAYVFSTHPNECKGTIHFPLPLSNQTNTEEAQIEIRKQKSRMSPPSTHQGSSGVLNPGQSLPILVGQRAIEALLSLRAAPARSTPPSRPPTSPPPRPGDNHAPSCKPRSPPSDPLPPPPMHRVGGLAAPGSRLQHRLKVPFPGFFFTGPRTLISITTRNHSPVCVCRRFHAAQEGEGRMEDLLWCDMESRAAGDTCRLVLSRAGGKCRWPLRGKTDTHRGPGPTDGIRDDGPCKDGWSSLRDAFFFAAV